MTASPLLNPAELAQIPLKTRLDFPILQRELPPWRGQARPLVYLDNAATTQKPRQVMEAMDRYYQESNSNVHRAIHTLGEEATRLMEAARTRVKDFLKARSTREIIFTRGTTEAINLVANSFGRLLKAGDQIVLTQMEHHSNIVPWQILARDRGVEILWAPVDDQGVLELDELEKLLGPRVKLLSLTMMSNVLGTINPVKRIVELAHSRGIPVLLDGAQGVPHTAVDVTDLDVDFLAFSGHKICGPTGIGVLYGKESWLEKMDPWQGGGEMIRSVNFEGFVPNELPYKFEAGTPDMAGTIGLHAALDYVEDLGLENIHAWEQVLTQRALEHLRRIPELRILGEAPDRGGIAAFSIEGIHAHDLSAFLDQRGIAVRAGHHCAHPLGQRLGVISSARASFYFYNTLEEVDLFLEVLEEARRKL